MVFNLSTLLATYLDNLNLAPQAGGLGMTVILGFPDVGRPEAPPFPLGALKFEEDNFLTVPKRVTRLGTVPPLGTTVRVNLYLFAASEMELLGLVDRLRAVRERVAVLDSEGMAFALAYAPTKRETFDQTNPNLRYVTSTAITLSLI